MGWMVGLWRSCHSKATVQAPFQRWASERRTLNDGLLRGMAACRNRVKR